MERIERVQKFGVELEVATSKGMWEILETLKRNGINIIATSYGRGVELEAWKIHRDGSLGKGWEIVSPPLYNTEELEKVCEILRKDLKCRSSIKCGLHVHHDISDLTVEQIKNVYRLYTKYENNAIKSIQSPHRHNNSYCKSVNPLMEKVSYLTDTTEWRQFCKDTSRYHKLNAASYLKFNTLEFREAQGTVEVDRVLAWIDLTNKMIETAMNITQTESLKATTTEESLIELCEELHVSPQTMKHYKSVQKYFKKVGAWKETL